MVGGDRVAEHAHDPRTANVVDVADIHGHAVEVGRVLDVGGGLVPGVEVAVGRLDPGPAGVALEHVGVVLLEHFRADRPGDEVADFLVAGPDVAQEHRIAVAVVAQRFVGQVDVDRAGQRVGDHQRRRGEVVHLHLGVDAAFEVAVAREHRGHGQVVLGNAAGHRLGQRAGVADAGGAAVADHVETQLLQIVEHACLAQVIGDHQRARPERGLHPGCRLEPLGDGVARQQAGTEHHRGVGGVGTGGDGRDHHRAVAQLVFAVLEADRGDRLGGQAFGLRLVAPFLLEPADLWVAGGVARGHQRADVVAEVLLHLLQQHAVLRALRTGQGRFDFAHVELEHRGVRRRRLARFVPQPLRPGIGLDQRDLLFAAARQAQVAQRLGIDREDAAGGAVLGRHVADGGAVGQRQVLQSFAEEFHELADHPVLAQHLGHRQHQVGGGRAFGQPPGQAEADHLRDQHRRGLAEHRRLGLDAAHAPAQHADAVDHRGVAVGAEHRIRIGPGPAVALGGHHHARQMLQVDLVDDAGVGRHHLEVVERLLPPAQETVALLVALELDLAVEVERVGPAKHVHLHGVVDHQFGRDQRIDLLWPAAEPDHRIAHGCQVDHAGHAGEVLQHHAGGHERDLDVGFGLRVPVGDRLDVPGEHGHAVFLAEQVLQQDLHRVRQTRDIEPFAQLRQAGIGQGLVADLKGGVRGERVGHGGTPLAVGCGVCRRVYADRCCRHARTAGVADSMGAQVWSRKYV